MLMFFLGIEYQVIASYEPQQLDRCIECETGDTVFVQLPFVFEFQVRSLDLCMKVVLKELDVLRF